ncbi:MAG: hypothetical protein HOL02_18015, partial [Rhodospirillaceae bacterium]|nr:hypothetical protein [Rhodospirillaceae bacterium]
MDLKRLLDPSSIAIVGASERPSIGRTILQALEVLGYQGAVYPVHPRNETVLGQACYVSLDAVPGPIDLVAICLGKERILGEVEKAAALGVGAIVIYSGGFAEAGDEGRAQQDEIVRLCRENNIVLCGPNCMGVMGLHQGSHAYMMDILDADALRGNVGLISQSGSISIGMLTDTRRYGFSHIISTGNEALISTAAYIEYLIDDPETGIIALFSESIKEPDRFVAALDRAAQMGKPVVVLKAGKSARAAAAIQTHTGGMAGQAQVFSAVLKAHHAIEVNDLEELTEVLSVLQGARLPTGDRIAVVTGSGGHAELLLDMSSRAGINLPPLPIKTRETIEAGVGSLTGDGNPIDAWGQGDFSENFTLAFGEAASSGAYDAVVLSIDANDGQAIDYLGQDEVVTRLLIDTNASIEQPLYLMSTRHGVQKSIQVDAIQKHGIATISGMVQGLGAIGRVAQWNNRTASAVVPAEQTGGTAPDWASRVSVHEFDAKQLLAEAGLSITSEHIVTTVDAAQDAAEAIGFPVVMKAVGDRIPHRSEHGLIELRLSDREAIVQAWARL